MRRLLAAAVVPGHKVADCGLLGGPGASARSLVGRLRVPKILGLLPAHWQVKPDPGVSTGLLTGRAGSWSLAAGSRDPRAGVRSLPGVGREGSCHSWVWGPGCPEGRVGLLVGRAWAQLVPG